MVNMANGNPVSNAINRARRKLVLNHVWAQDVAIYRKASTRPDEDNDPSNERTIGGAMELGLDDSSQYVLEVIGAAKMVLCSQHGGSEHAGDWMTFNVENGSEIPAMIEPINDGEFTVQKYDRIYVILPNFTYCYQVTAIKSPSSLPQGRSSVYMLEPLEQSGEPDFNDLI